MMREIEVDLVCVCVCLYYVYIYACLRMCMSIHMRAWMD